MSLTKLRRECKASQNRQSRLPQSVSAPRDVVSAPIRVTGGFSMPARRSSTLQAKTLAVIPGVLMAASLAWASSEQVLYSFSNNGTNGFTPYSSLVFDGSGNLYGTTAVGGEYGCGTVFELSPTGTGWTETVIYSFQNNSKDGCMPYAGLIFDGAGNLYGTTYAGGGGGNGTVFEVSPAGNGQWKEELLTAFAGSRGAYPIGGLTFDPAGNLYGTTVSGGNGSCTGGCGTVFQLTPAAKGRWNETVLHTFAGAGEDGAWPYSAVIFDASGNLYGTTFAGGRHSSGTVFELTPGGNSRWSETVLYSFNNNGKDAMAPAAGLVFDGSGNLYGTASSGGKFQLGAVFELSPGASGWTESLLHSFSDNGKDGYQPYSGLVISPAGKLYGTTSQGGSNGSGWGTVFAMTNDGRGNWRERVLYSFKNNGSDGYDPYLGNVILDAKGHLYGTTAYGGSGSNCGTSGCGTVFEVIP